MTDAAAGRATSRTLERKAIRRVLLIRLDGVGDLVLTTPLIVSLRRAFPTSWITAVVAPAAAELLGACPHVNEVLTFDPFGGKVRRSARAAMFALRRLACERFDVALLPRVESDFWRGTLPARLSRATRRVGHGLAPARRGRWLHELRLAALTDVVPAATGHEVERNVAVLGALGVAPRAARLELWTADADERFADLALRERGVTQDERLVTLAVGASSGRRQWPLDRYVAVAERLHRRHGIRCLLVGGSDEAGRVSELATAEWVAADLVGRTTLRQTAALMRRTRWYLGGDTGPMHMAAALGLGVVEVSCHPRTGAPAHLNSPIRYGPWGTRSVVLQPDRALPPCSDGCDADSPHCITAVTVDEVQAAVEGLL